MSANQNLFKIAMERDELYAFLCGTPPYFIREPDTGEHSYLNAIIGHMGTYIKDGENSFSDFSVSLAEKIDEMIFNEAPLTSILSILLGVATLEEKDIISSSDLQLFLRDVFPNLIPYVISTVSDGNITQERYRNYERVLLDQTNLFAPIFRR